MEFSNKWCMIMVVVTLALLALPLADCRIQAPDEQGVISQSPQEQDHTFSMDVIMPERLASKFIGTRANERSEQYGVKIDIKKRTSDATIFTIAGADKKTVIDAKNALELEFSQTDFPHDLSRRDQIEELKKLAKQSGVVHIEATESTVYIWGDHAKVERLKLQVEDIIGQIKMRDGGCPEGTDTESATQLNKIVEALPENHKPPTREEFITAATELRGNLIFGAENAEKRDRKLAIAGAGMTCKISYDGEVFAIDDLWGKQEFRFSYSGASNFCEATIGLNNRNTISKKNIFISKYVINKRYWESYEGLDDVFHAGMKKNELIPVATQTCKTKPLDGGMKVMDYMIRRREYCSDLLRQLKEQEFTGETDAATKNRAAQSDAQRIDDDDVFKGIFFSDRPLGDCIQNMFQKNRILSKNKVTLQQQWLHIMVGKRRTARVGTAEQSGLKIIDFVTAQPAHDKIVEIVGTDEPFAVDSDSSEDDVKRVLFGDRN